MDHYVCKGECGGVSEAPKACETEGCSKKGDALEKCVCEDGAHGNGGGEGSVAAENPKEGTV